MIDAPRPVGPRRVRDHRRPQPLHPGRRAVRPGLRGRLGRRRHGPQPPARRRARREGRPRRPPRRRRSSARAHDGRPTDARAPPPGHRRRRVHRLGAGPPGPGPPRRHPGHRPRQAHLRRQPRQPGARSSRTTEQAARFAFVQGDIADPEVGRRRSWRQADAVVNVAAETHVDRSILDPEAFLRTGVIGVHVLLEAVRREQDAAGRPPVPPGQHGRGLRRHPDGREPRGRHPRPAQPVRRRQGGGRAAGPRLPRHLRPRHRDHPRLQHLRPAPAPREADPAVHDERPGRRAAADVRRRDAGPRLAPRRGPRRRASSSCSTTASRARPTTSPATTCCRTAR